MEFRGGKMFHCFDMRRVQYDSYYVPILLDDEIREALVKGQWLVKIDGRNGLLIYNEEKKHYDIHVRYDDNKNHICPSKLPSNYYRLPQSKNPDNYEVKNKIHYYYYCKKLRFENPKGENIMWMELYEKVDKAHSEGKLNDENGNPRKYHSIELVGKYFSQTPGVVGVNFILHEKQKMDKPSILPSSDREWYDYFMNYFMNVCQEGIVIEYQGYYWKILSEMFDVDTLWKIDRTKAVPPLSV